MTRPPLIVHLGLTWPLRRPLDANQCYFSGRVVRSLSTAGPVDLVAATMHDRLRAQLNT
jgi:hypothetical protein